MTVNLHIARLVVEDTGDGNWREADMEKHIRLDLTNLLQTGGLPMHLQESCAKPVATTQNASEPNNAIGIGQAIYGGFDR